MLRALEMLGKESTAVGEITSNVLFGPGEWDLVDPVVDVVELFAGYWWCVHKNVKYKPLITTHMPMPTQTSIP